jgi:hypothetical protein
MSQEETDENAEFAELWKTVQDHPESLSDSQKALLNSALKVAWVASATDKQLAKGFDESFTAEQAALIREYPSQNGRVHLLPRLFDGFIKLT